MSISSIISRGFGYIGEFFTSRGYGYGTLPPYQVAPLSRTMYRTADSRTMVKPAISRTMIKPPIYRAMSKPVELRTMVKT